MSYTEKNVSELQEAINEELQNPFLVEPLTEEEVESCVELLVNHKAKAIYEFMSLKDMFTSDRVDRYVWDWKVREIQYLWELSSNILEEDLGKEIEPFNHWLRDECASKLEYEGYMEIVDLINIRLEEDLF